jgi:hypothetical protein
MDQTGKPAPLVPVALHPAAYGARPLIQGSIQCGCTDDESKSSLIEKGFSGAEYRGRIIEHRVGDTRILRLVQKWLRAGVLEDGVVTIEEKGTGQGSVISPLLANIYLHYVFDLWAERWRQREATGDMFDAVRHGARRIGARA